MEPLSSNPSPSAPPSRSHEVPQTSANPKDKGNSPIPSEQRESVSISETGQEINQHTEAMANLPDFRQERIAQIQAAIEQGTYSVSAEDLADKLIQDIANLPPDSSSSST